MIKCIFQKGMRRPSKCFDTKRVSRSSCEPAFLDQAYLSDKVKATNKRFMTIVIMENDCLHFNGTVQLRKKLRMKDLSTEYNMTPHLMVAPPLCCVGYS